MEAEQVQGDKVKKGQTVAYIEQLGTFVPVEVSRIMPLNPVMLAFAVSWHMAVPVCNQSTS